MKQRPTQRSSGSAHLGRASGFAWMRGPLLAPEDAGGAAGGSSGGESTTPSAPQPGATTQGTSGTAPGGTSEKLLPQSQVNALVAAARREGREQAQREQQQQPRPQPAAAAPRHPVANKTVRDQISELREENRVMRERSRFEREASRLGMDDAVTDKLFSLARATNVAPDNFGTWLGETATQFGIKQAPATTTTAADTAATTPAAAAPGAPVRVDPLLANSGLVDIFNLTPAQLTALGPSGVRAEYEKILAVAQQQQGAPPRPKLPQR